MIAYKTRELDHLIGNNKPWKNQEALNSLNQMSNDEIQKNNSITKKD